MPGRAAAPAGKMPRGTPSPGGGGQGRGEKRQLAADEALQLVQHPFHPQHEILGPPGGGDDAVGHRLLQFRFGGAGFLRDREVLLESVRAADGHGAPHPYQFPVLERNDLFILEIEDLLGDLHGQPPWQPKETSWSVLHN